jgi:hypothetical protein
MKNQKLIKLLGIFSILLLGCSTLSGGNNSTNSIIINDVNSGESNNDNNFDSSGPSIIMEDDFSSTDSGWPEGEDEFSSSYYVNDAFEVSIFVEDYISWVYMNDYYQNMIIEVDATFFGGGDDNSFGVICRHADEDNFYVFVISADGYLGIGKTIDGGEITIIENENLESSDAINMGFATNHIKAACIDETFTMWVNGQLVAEVQDSSISSGSYGMFVGTFSSTETAISFDNLKILQP